MKLTKVVFDLVRGNKKNKKRKWPSVDHGKFCKLQNKLYKYIMLLDSFLRYIVLWNNAIFKLYMDEHRYERVTDLIT